MDTAVTGDRLYDLTRAPSVRPFFIVLLGTLFVGLGAMVLTTAKTPGAARQGVEVLLALAAVAVFVVALWFNAMRLKAVCERGLVVTTRGRTRFVPWDEVARIERLDQSARGGRVLGYIVHLGGRALVLSEHHLGAMAAGAVVRAIAERAGMVWAPDGQSAARAGDAAVARSP